MILGEKGLVFVVFLSSRVMGFDLVDDFGDCFRRGYREEFGCGLLMCKGFGHAPDYEDGNDVDSTGYFER